MSATITKKVPLPLPLDVIPIILSYLGVQERGHLLRVSRAFFDLALPYAWYEVNGIHAIYLLLPVTLKPPTKSKAPRISPPPTSVWFRPGEFDREHLIRLTKHVKILNIFSGGNGYRFHNRGVLRNIAPLTPQLQKLVIHDEGAFTSSVRQLVPEVISFCGTTILRSLSLVNRTHYQPVKLNRKDIVCILHALQEHAQSIQEISLRITLDFAETELLTPSLILFSGLPHITRLSLNSTMLGPNLAPLHHLAQLPNLTWLELYHWVPALTPNFLYTTPQARRGVWFPQLREILLTRVMSEQADYLLDTVFPATMEVVELQLTQRAYNIDSLASTLVKHRHSLHTLKIDILQPTYCETVTIMALRNLSRLTLLRTLEVRNHRVAALDPETFGGSWPYIEQLRWPSQRVPVTYLRSLAQRCPRLNTLHLSIDLSDRNQFVTSDAPQRRPNNGLMTYEDQDQLWFPISSVLICLWSDYKLDGLSREEIESFARYLVSCWSRVMVAQEVESINYNEQGLPVTEIDNDQNREKFKWLSMEISQSQSRLY